jgi:tetratricopeptide (TPR) repeat protein
VSDGIHQLQLLVNAGRYLEARQLADRLNKGSDGINTRANQLLALSLSKSGSPETAQELLEPIYQAMPEDVETAGILGGIYKELFKKHQDSKYAILSRDTYLKNFQATKHYYPGINAATMSAIAGRAAQGKEIATEVISLIDPQTTDFWELATLAEAYLLTKNRAQAVEYFIRTRQLAGTDWGKVTSVYNQLWLLNHYVPVPKEIQKVFSPPNVVAFVGHMLDQPSRTTPRFPASIETKIKDAVKGAIQTLNASIGYCSIACGGDILFAEAMEEAEGELQLFLPFAKDDFVEISVRFAGENWIGRFNQLIERHPVTYVTQETYAGYDDLFSLQSRVIFGSAVLRSAGFHQEPALLTVLSETDLKRKEGGTRDTIRLWPFSDKHININPDLYIGSTTAVTSTSSAAPVSERGMDRPVLYLVLADLTQLSPLDKEKINKAIQIRLSDGLLTFKAAEVLHDSMLVSFETETAAINFVQMVRGLLPKGDKSVKISLHAGPTYLDDDGQKFSGNGNINVSILRSINQFSPHGGIVASDLFAALLALNRKKFKLEYVGAIQPEDNKTIGLYTVLINQM